MSNYKWCALAIATDVDKGNMLSARMGVEPGDETAFTRGLPVYPAGTTFQRNGLEVIPSAQPVGRFIRVLLMQRGHDLAHEFVSAGPYTELGITQEQAAYIKSGVPHISIGGRELFDQWRAFIEAAGYVMP